ncbi:MAG TPA: hypothetical protein PKG60_01330 [Spirochaetota bacterium]|nr:hypothetical protein [Spirochaetota bacterium]HPS86052.1 hypothetical protein [Spirochaetota bacterium]
MKNKLAVSALKAFSIYAVVMVITVIAAEFIAPFKNFLAALTGHHWTSKGVLGALLFIILTIIFNVKGNDDNLGRNINLAIISAVSGSVVLFLFFALHYAL